MTVAPITQDELASLLAGHVRCLRHDHAVLDLIGTGDDQRLRMTGPSGQHSLLVLATDLFRLNAHWSVFAADPRNARKEIA